MTGDDRNVAKMKKSSNYSFSSPSSSSSPTSFVFSAITLITLVSPARSFQSFNYDIISQKQTSYQSLSPASFYSPSFSMKWRKNDDHGQKEKRQRHQMQFTMTSSSSSSQTPIIFKSIGLSDRKILARSDATDVLNTLKEWANSDKSDEEKINSWVEQGLVFWLDEDAADAAIELVPNALENSGASVKKIPTASSVSTLTGDIDLLYDDGDNEGSVVGLPNKAFTTADVYINLEENNKDTLCLLKASKAKIAPKLSSNDRLTKGLVKRGEIFNDLEWFFEDRNLTRKGNEIATRMKEEFPLDSKEWKLWTSKTDEYNATSLTQVFGEYFRDFSAGDNGGVDVSDAHYISKPGYPGTLAPGTEFKQDADIEDLPHYILHPWPAMQEIKAHGRNPPAHPMIPPPLLWFAMNDMYTQNFTEWQLHSDSSSETVGGYMMEPKDAIRIAKYHKIGLSYAPEDQLEHGGMIFDGGIGGVIPNYNPDHGPTVPEEEAAAPIPDHLQSITTRWLDPYFQLDILLANSIVSAEEEKTAKDEEKIRRIAAEKKISEFGREIHPLREEVLPTSKPDVSMLHSRSLKDSKALYFDNIKRGSSGEITLSEEDIEALKSIEENDDIETILTEEVKQREEIVKVAVDDLDEVAAGRTRGRKQLVGYAIETIRDMQAEISRAERDTATKKKSGRRKQRRANAEANEFLQNNLDMPSGVDALGE